MITLRPLSETLQKFYETLDPLCKVKSLSCGTLLKDQGSCNISFKGLICVIKDYRRNKYVLQLFDENTQTRKWEVPICNKFTYKVFENTIHTVSSMDGEVQITFSDVREAEIFSSVILKLTENLKKQNNARKFRNLREFDKVNVTKSESSPCLSRFRIGKCKKLLAKIDIGFPYDFRHVKHGGRAHKLFDKSPVDAGKDVFGTFEEAVEVVEEQHGPTTPSNEIPVRRTASLQFLGQVSHRAQSAPSVENVASIRSQLLESSSLTNLDGNTLPRTTSPKLEVTDECIICMTRPSDCALIECGHNFTCWTCSQQLSECPICRDTIVRLLKLYR